MLWNFADYLMHHQAHEFCDTETKDASLASSPCGETKVFNTFTKLCISQSYKKKVISGRLIPISTFI